MSSRRVFVVSLFGWVLPSLSGCGGADPYDTTLVSGVLTCQGKPVANGTVNFTPMPNQGQAEGRRGRVALGMTDKEGRFKLTTYENNDGAIVGKHTVTVGLNGAEGVNTDPSKGFACSKSSKEITVERGIKEYKIDFLSSIDAFFVFRLPHCI